MCFVGSNVESCFGQKNLVRDMNENTSRLSKVRKALKHVCVCEHDSEEEVESM